LFCVCHGSLVMGFVKCFGLGTGTLNTPTSQNWRRPMKVGDLVRNTKNGRIGIVILVRPTGSFLKVKYTHYDRAWFVPAHHLEALNAEKKI